MRKFVNNFLECIKIKYSFVFYRCKFGNVKNKKYEIYKLNIKIDAYNYSYKLENSLITYIESNFYGLMFYNS